MAATIAAKAGLARRARMAGTTLAAAALCLPFLMTLDHAMCTAFVTPTGRVPPPPSTTLQTLPVSAVDVGHRIGRGAYISLRMGLLDGVFQQSPPKEKIGELAAECALEVLDEVGSGSYGTVHLARLVPKDGEGRDKFVICKRAWTLEELREKSVEAAAGAGDDSSEGEAREKTALSEEDLRDLADRCDHYLDVERHCLAKLAVTDGNDALRVPKFLGVHPYNGRSGNWLVFDLVAGEDGGGAGTTPARTLGDVLEMDWIDQHEQKGQDAPHHHLYLLQKEMGMEDSAAFAEVLDETLLQLLRTISGVNEANVVHRDVKPGNLLVTAEWFTLIDFGSAADLDPPSGPLGSLGGLVGLDDRVALSPIYAAPETFVKKDRCPTHFDAFSTALVFTQLLFNLLDERADASFRQQLEDVDFDLDLWLQRELKEELQPDGIEDAMAYLADRPGLWAVLRGMLREDPEKRLSTAEALRGVDDIFTALNKGGEEGLTYRKADGDFFAGVLESLELCELPDSGSAIGVPDSPDPIAAAPAQPSAFLDLVVPHPLHYVATFSRSQSLGLVLSEVDPEGKYDDDLSEEDSKLWREATSNAKPGEVYVRGIVEGGQADDIGVFNVGDRVMGVGEFPFIAEGFDVVVEMLGRQPPSAKTVTLHFDRKPTGRSLESLKTAPHHARVIDQGVWSATGRRKAQEDGFILQEIRDGNNAALLAGVFDGHGGNAASRSLAQLTPSLFSVQLAGILTDGKDRASPADLRAAMESAFDIACQTYRNGCDELETCVADYDPREGIVLAAMGAKDVIAGSTATMSVVSTSEDGADELSVLNCGDSRTLVVGRPREGTSTESVVHFSTRDHSPSCEVEMERLSLGKDKGYSQPKCSMGRWRIKVGDFNYGLARSLEGSFTTSKGIVSDPDVSLVNLSETLAERELVTLILASDGLFEVIDNEEAGRIAIKCREEGLEASLAAKQLCLKAIDKGSPDNVSVVVVYLEG